MIIATNPHLEQLAEALCVAYWSDNIGDERAANIWSSLPVVTKGQWRRAALAVCRELLGADA